MAADTYALPALPYGKDALAPSYSAELLEIHHGKHHAAYVKGANQVLADLAQCRAGNDYRHLAQLQRDLAFNVSGHALHSLFWQSMSPDGGGDPKGALLRAVEHDLGSVDAARQQMGAAALSIQGSGWAALSWEPISGRLVVEQRKDHQSSVTGGAVPLLVLDMWEHAFYLQYRNEKKKWVAAFWNLVDWAGAAERFGSLQGSARAR